MLYSFPLCAACHDTSLSGRLFLFFFASPEEGKLGELISKRGRHEFDDFRGQTDTVGMVKLLREKSWRNDENDNNG